MFKTLMREITLSIQAKNGASVAVMVWLGIMALALITAFVFLCVGGYDWFAVAIRQRLRRPDHGRHIRRDRHRRRSSSAPSFAAASASAPFSPARPKRMRRRGCSIRKFSASPCEAGRTIGWQRLVPLALLGFMAAQWARENRDRQTGSRLVIRSAETPEADGANASPRQFGCRPASAAPAPLPRQTASRRGARR